MKHLLLLFSLSFWLTFNAQIVTTQNTSSPSACDGSAYIADSTAIDSIVAWNFNNTIIQNGGFFVDQLCAGTYILEYIFNGNTQYYTFIIGSGTTNPCSGFVITASSADPTALGLCDGMAIVSVTGGTAPYTYTWNNGVTSATNSQLCEGYYYCTVADAAGCNGTYTVLVGQGNANSNDSIVVFDNTDTNTMVVDTLGSNWVENCVLDFLTVDSVFINGYGYSALDSSLFVNYVFVDSNGVIILQLTSNYIDSTTANGYYTTFLTLYCPQKSTQLKYIKVVNQIYLGTDLGVNETAESQFSVVNPFENELSLKFEKAENYTIQLLDIQGKVVLNDHFEGDNKVFNTQNLNQGVYFLKVECNGVVSTRKILK